MIKRFTCVVIAAQILLSFRINGDECPDITKKIRRDFYIEKFSGIWYGYMRKNHDRNLEKYHPNNNPIYHPDVECKCVVANISVLNYTTATFWYAGISEPGEKPMIAEGLISTNDIFIKRKLRLVHYENYTSKNNILAFEIEYPIVLGTDYYNYIVFYACKPNATGNRTEHVWALTRKPGLSNGTDDRCVRKKIEDVVNSYWSFFQPGSFHLVDHRNCPEDIFSSLHLQK